MPASFVDHLVISPEVLLYAEEFPAVKALLVTARLELSNAEGRYEIYINSTAKPPGIMAVDIWAWPKTGDSGNVWRLAEFLLYRSSQ